MLWTLSTPSSQQRHVHCPLLFLWGGNNQLIGLADVQHKIIVLGILNQIVYLPPVFGFIITRYSVNDSYIVDVFWPHSQGYREKYKGLSMQPWITHVLMISKELLAICTDWGTECRLLHGQELIWQLGKIFLHNECVTLVSRHFGLFLGIMDILLNQVRTLDRSSDMLKMCTITPASWSAEVSIMMPGTPIWPGAF